MFKYPVQFDIFGGSKILVSLSEPIAVGPASILCEDCKESVYPVFHSESLYCPTDTHVAADGSEIDYHSCEWHLPCHQSWCDSCHSVTDYPQCSNCETCENCCECVRCGYCGEVAGSQHDHELCEHCSYCRGCCECVRCGYCDRKLSADEYLCCECQKCENHCCQCSDLSELSADVTDWLSADVACRDAVSEHLAYVNPVQSMADFYLADYVMALAGTSRLAADAKRLQDSVIALCDPAFRDYAFMAIGGELRHHSVIRTNGILSSDRAMAGTYFTGLADVLGRERVLEDAVTIFEDDTWRAGYGGAPWAHCASITLARENGTFDARTFVDRVFNAQHNGGSFLNKSSWKDCGYMLSDMQAIGNAHSADETDFQTLIIHCSSDAIALLRALAAHNAFRFPAGMKGDVTRIFSALSNAKRARKFNYTHSANYVPFTLDTDGYWQCECGIASCPICNPSKLSDSAQDRANRVWRSLSFAATDAGREWALTHTAEENACEYLQVPAIPASAPTAEVSESPTYAGWNVDPAKCADKCCQPSTCEPF